MYFIVFLISNMYNIFNKFIVSCNANTIWWEGGIRFYSKNYSFLLNPIRAVKWETQTREHTLGDSSEHMCPAFG